MSVLIRGMEMPKMCSRCPLRYVAYLGVSICQVTNKRLEITRERPNDCPLVEVPTPHGDLVDLSDMVHPNDSMRIMTIDEQLRRTCEGWSADRKEYVVIKAEGSENENNNV